MTLASNGDGNDGPGEATQVRLKDQGYAVPGFEVAVIGVGNTIRSDDGVGVHASRMLLSDPRMPAGITVLDGGTLGLQLIPYVADASCLLFLDAIDSGAPPGTIVRMTEKDFLGMTAGLTVHRLGLADLLASLALMSKSHQDIVVLGVCPANTDWGTTLSHEVETALGPLLDAALAQLQLWHSQLRNDGPGSSHLSLPAGPSN